MPTRCLSRTTASVMALAAVLSACSASSDLSPAPPPPDNSSGVSATASSVTLSAERVAVGDAITIVITPRAADRTRFGADRTVQLRVADGTATGRLSAARYFGFDSTYRATFVALSTGSPVRVTAIVNGVTLATAPSITVHEPSPSWTFCSLTGAVCEFIGRRDVRLIANNGQSVTQTFYGSVPCARDGYARGFRDAPAADYVRCEIGPAQFDVLENLMPGMAGLDADLLLVPRGDAGVATPLVRTDPFTGVPSSEGSFRMTCELSHMAFVDPIVYPGAANQSHLHMFFGNTGITSNSTAASARTTGNGTCAGGTINRTGYWVPALFDVRTSDLIAPAAATIYYKTGFNVEPATVRTIPEGLVMIAGNPSNVGQPQVINQLPVVTWECERTATTNTGAIPSCPVGDIVRLVINFPQCWDGIRLDSPDHKQHMAYPEYRSDARSRCPASHPVMLPIITEIFRWPVQAGANPAFWRLTSDMYPITMRGGYSAHADWMNGWSAAELETIVVRCLQASKDCGVNALGDGRALF